MFENVMAKEQPTHVLVAFDAGKTTFRTAMYEEYKGGRSKNAWRIQGTNALYSRIDHRFRCSVL